MCAQKSTQSKVRSGMDVLVTRFLFAFTFFLTDKLVFSSSSIPKPRAYDIVWLLGVYVLGRILFSMISVILVKADETTGQRVYGTLVQLGEAHWMILMYVVLRWLTALFESWWEEAGSWIVSFVITDLVVLMLQAWTVWVSDNRSQGQKKILESILDNVGFSIAFFVAAQLTAGNGHTPSTWDFLWIVGVVGGTFVCSNKLRGLWQHSGNPQLQKLQLVVEKHVAALAMTSSFVVISMFTKIFTSWWIEGESTMASGCVFSAIVVTALFAVEFVGKKLPPTLVDRSLFSMSMFLSSTITERLQLVPEVTVVLMFFVGVISVFGTFSAIQVLWETSIEQRKAVAVPNTVAARNIDAEELVKTVVIRLCDTGNTFLIGVLVRWLIAVLNDWWYLGESLLIDLCVVEIMVLFLIQTSNGS